MGEIFTGNVFLLVTGASRGIGKQIAEVFGSVLEQKSHVLLLARDIMNLKKTINELPKTLVTHYRSIDFSNTNTEELRDAILEALQNEQPQNFSQAIIVHNAAAANFSQLTTDMTNFIEWNKCFNLNVFSPAILNGVFMKIFHYPSTIKFVINISSYWSMKPDKSVGSYCSAKAAKDMFFKVFALENPDVNVLNYLPGYVKTDMYYDCINKKYNDLIRNHLLGYKDCISPRETANYLMEILRKNEYKSGDTVDYLKKS